MPGAVLSRHRRSSLPSTSFPSSWLVLTIWPVASGEVRTFVGFDITEHEWDVFATLDDMGSLWARASLGPRACPRVE